MGSWTKRSSLNHWINFSVSWICTSMQNISLFHLLIFANFRVTWPDHPHPFLTMINPKNVQSPFNLHEFVHAKNQLIPSVYSWDTTNFKESRDQIGHTYFFPCRTKIFRSTFNFYEFVSTCQKWVCFLNFFWINIWFKNPKIWLPESILAYISGTRFFSIGFVQEHSK